MPFGTSTFIITTDVLSICTQEAIQCQRISGFSLGDVMVQILKYADDSLFFVEGSSATANLMGSFMNIFTDMLGLEINYYKSAFIPFSMDLSESVACSISLNTQRAQLPIRYLGLPLSSGHILLVAWSPIIDRFEKRFAGWRDKLLSRSGHLILIRSVLQSIPIHFLSTFHIPIGVKYQHEKLQRSFF